MLGAFSNRSGGASAVREIFLSRRRFRMDPITEFKDAENSAALTRLLF
jgi:hypothetical protein